MQNIGSIEAAEILGVHRTRINQLIDEGKLSGTKIGHSLVFDRRDVERLAETLKKGNKKRGRGRPSNLSRLANE
jgi:excisionase family DNA binding protein